MESDFESFLLEEQKRHQPFQRRRALLTKIHEFAEKIKKQPAQWRPMDIILFIKNFETEFVFTFTL